METFKIPIIIFFLVHFSVIIKNTGQGGNDMFCRNDKGDMCYGNEVQKRDEEDSGGSDVCGPLIPAVRTYCTVHDRVSVG